MRRSSPPLASQAGAPWGIDEKQLITGMELDDEGVTHILDAATWHQRCLCLNESGGPLRM